jgi:hypothetical protein
VAHRVLATTHDLGHVAVASPTGRSILLLATADRNVEEVDERPLASSGVPHSLVFHDGGTRLFYASQLGQLESLSIEAPPGELRENRRRTNLPGLGQIAANGSGSRVALRIGEEVWALETPAGAEGVRSQRPVFRPELVAIPAPDIINMTFIGTAGPLLLLSEKGQLWRWDGYRSAARVVGVAPGATRVLAAGDDLLFAGHGADARVGFTSGESFTVSTTRSSIASDTGWWTAAVFYRVRLSTFADGDGDGLGDLAGLQARLDYLTWLGVDGLVLELDQRPPAARPDGQARRDRPPPGIANRLDKEQLTALTVDAHRRGLRVVLALDRTRDNWASTSRSRAEARWLSLCGIDAFELRIAGIADHLSYLLWEQLEEDQAIVPVVFLDLGRETTLAHQPSLTALRQHTLARIGRQGRSDAEIVQGLAQWLRHQADAHYLELDDLASTRASNDVRSLAILTLGLALPVIPVIRAGSEIGLQSTDRSGHPPVTMPWTSDTVQAPGRLADTRFLRGRPQGPSQDHRGRSIASQQQSPSSLLNLVRRQLVLRKQCSAFTNGVVVGIASDNSHVLAFLRRNDRQCLLCIYNVSATEQVARLLLPSEHVGAVPFDLIGRVSFPPVASDPYPFTLQAYEFVWLELQTPNEPPI